MLFQVKSKLKPTSQWFLLLFFAALINFNFCLGQNLGGSLTIDPGYSIMQVKDTRHSSVFRTAQGWNFGLKYELQGERSANALGFKFVQIAGSLDKGFATNVSALEIQIFYEHLRTLKNKNWQIGAYLDHGFYLTDRYAGNWYGSVDDPTFSYVIWSSLGLTGKYHKALGENWHLNLKAALPLIAFTERPAYAFVFPEDHYSFNDFYLLFQPEYFERAQFRTFTQFTNLQLQTGLQHRIGKRGSAIGLNYQWSYLFAAGVKPLFRYNHHFTIVYQLSFKKS
jgi:hypothetical protein